MSGMRRWDPIIIYGKSELGLLFADGLKWQNETPIRGRREYYLGKILAHLKYRIKILRRRRDQFWTLVYNLIFEEFEESWDDFKVKSIINLKVIYEKDIGHLFGISLFSTSTHLMQYNNIVIEK